MMLERMQLLCTMANFKGVRREALRMKKTASKLDNASLVQVALTLTLTIALGQLSLTFTLTFALTFALTFHPHLHSHLHPHLHPHPCAAV